MAMAVGVDPTGASSIASVGMLWDTCGCAFLRRVPIVHVHALVFFRSYLLVTATQGAVRARRRHLRGMAHGMPRARRAGHAACASGK